MKQGLTISNDVYRLSTVLNADRTLALDSRQIVGMVCRDELMVEADRYAHLRNLQLAEAGKAIHQY